MREKRLRSDRNPNSDKMKGKEAAGKLGESTPESSKKEKRKLNKRKRRKRIQILSKTMGDLEQGIHELKNIFEKIYYMGSNFEELQE